jgi:general secretion pathway protein K
VASPSPSEKKKKKRLDESGIALFMVMSAMSILSILVTEFTYIAQISQKLAFDGLDQVKAHYLAKSAMKLSLLRLVAYTQVKAYVKTMTGGAGAAAAGVVPQALLDKVWSYPFFYPIPTEIPGMSPIDRDKIKKFQADSGLEGKYSAVIESESSKYNLNMILSQFVPSGTPSPGPSPSARPSTPTGPNPQANAAPAFNPDDARKSLSDYLQNMINAKVEADADFAEDYRDFKMDDLMDNIISWADRTYESHAGLLSDFKPKKGPFYALTELHMMPVMDDTLYDLFAPALTVSTTPGININTMQEPTLRALVPGISNDEVKDFFKFRDSQDEDNTFKSDQDFFKYLQTNVVTVFHNDSGAIGRYQQDLQKRNIRLVVEETEFKITVVATINQTVRQMEAWVTLSGSPTPQPSGQPPTQAPPPLAGPGGVVAPQPSPDPGFRITFMKIL